MSKKRFLGSEFFKKPVKYGPNGNKLCLWCSTETKDKRQSVCSEACHYEIKIRSSKRFMISEVFKRDRGICQICNLDCHKLKHVLDSSSLKAKTRLLNFLKIPKTRRDYRLYDIDHIVPVSSGGGGINAGLENLRTLCIWCHEDVTKAYNKKMIQLAKRKK